MFILTFVYAFSGLFGHDPWKNDDASGFGVMWTLAHGGFQDWILPHLQGRNVLVGPPLPYWIGASSIHFLGPIIGEINAARLISGLSFILTAISIWYTTYLLGRRPEVQPMAFAFGGQPTPKEYGKTLADGSLLLFLACIGLAQRVHEMSPLLIELFGLALMLYGIVRGFDKPLQGGTLTGIGLVLIGLSGMLWLTTTLAIVTTLLYLSKQTPLKPGWILMKFLSLAIGLSIWPILLWQLHLSSEQYELVNKIWWGVLELESMPSSGSLTFLGINFWGYTWPIWPLAFWSFYTWNKQRSMHWKSPHILIPTSIFLSELFFFSFHHDLSERFLMLFIPPMAILAAFGLPFLRRGLISFIDWLSLLSFTTVAGFIWVIWFAKLTGVPESTANNISRFIPGFVAQFNPWDLFFALVITLLWILVVRWRVSRAPKMIWRCLVISAAGTTLMWVLLMTLWLPTINYAKTYAPVAERFAKALPKNARCVDSSYLGDAQLASFTYFTKIKLEDNEQCDYKLTHSSEEARASAILNRQQLTLIWEDRRDSDRDERLRLYHVIQAR